MLETLPLANITSFLGIVLIVVFFVTSSDSGSLVIDTITAGGKLDAPVAQRVFWCVLEGIVAIALLLGGGLVAAQAATLATGPPLRAGAGRHVLQHLEGAARKHSGQGQLTLPRVLCQNSALGG